MEPLSQNETPGISSCGAHGQWTPAVVGCKHIYTGSAEPAKIMMHFFNRKIACNLCFDNWNLLTYYCPACYTNRLMKYYPRIAQKIKDNDWFNKI